MVQKRQEMKRRDMEWTSEESLSRDGGQLVKRATAGIGYREERSMIEEGKRSEDG
jgi:hypothetical protein